MACEPIGRHADLVEKYNPFHDALGRFASRVFYAADAGGGGGSRKKKPKKKGGGVPKKKGFAPNERTIKIPRGGGKVAQKKVPRKRKLQTGAEYEPERVDIKGRAPSARQLQGRATKKAPGEKREVIPGGGTYRAPTKEDTIFEEMEREAERAENKAVLRRWETATGRRTHTSEMQPERRGREVPVETNLPAQESGTWTELTPEAKAGLKLLPKSMKDAPPRDKAIRLREIERRDPDPKRRSQAAAAADHIERRFGVKVQQVERMDPRDRPIRRGPRKKVQAPPEPERAPRAPADPNRQINRAIRGLDQLSDAEHGLPPTEQIDTLERKANEYRLKSRRSKSKQASEKWRGKALDADAAIAWLRREYGMSKSLGRHAYVLDKSLKGKFKELLHPRDAIGQFRTKNGSNGNGKGPRKTTGPGETLLPESKKNASDEEKARALDEIASREQAHAYTAYESDRQTVGRRHEEKAKLARQTAAALRRNKKKVTKMLGRHAALLDKPGIGRHAEVLDKGVRRVRTPAGAKRYKRPIGSPIGPSGGGGGSPTGIMQDMAREAFGAGRPAPTKREKRIKRKRKQMSDRRLKVEDEYQRRLKANPLVTESDRSALRAQVSREMSSAKKKRTGKKKGVRVKRKGGGSRGAARSVAFGQMGEAERARGTAARKKSARAGKKKARTPDVPREMHRTTVSSPQPRPDFNAGEADAPPKAAAGLKLLPVRVRNANPHAQVQSLRRIAVRASNKADHIEKLQRRWATDPEAADLRDPNWRDEVRRLREQATNATEAMLWLNQTANLGYPTRGMTAKNEHIGRHAMLLEKKKHPKGESPEARRKGAEKGTAMPDGSYPVPDLAHLNKAIQAWGRCPPEKRASLKRFLLKRAKALGASDEVIERINNLKP